MRWPKRKRDRIFGRGSLQFKIKAATEPFPQRQSPGAVQATAEWRVNYDVRTTVLIKESFGDDLLLRRHHAQRDLRHRQVLDDLLRRTLIQADFIHQPIHTRAA